MVNKQLEKDFFTAFNIQEGYIGWSDTDCDYYGYDFVCGKRKFFKTIDDLDNANYNLPSGYGAEDKDYPPITRGTLMDLFLLANQQEDLGRDLVSFVDLTEKTLQILIKHKDNKEIQKTIQFIFYEKEV